MLARPVDKVCLKKSLRLLLSEFPFSQTTDLFFDFLCSYTLTSLVLMFVLIPILQRPLSLTPVPSIGDENTDRDIAVMKLRADLAQAKQRHDDVHLEVITCSSYSS